MLILLYTNAQFISDNIIQIFNINLLNSITFLIKSYSIILIILLIALGFDLLAITFFFIISFCQTFSFILIKDLILYSTLLIFSFNFITNKEIIPITRKRINF